MITTMKRRLLIINLLAVVSLLVSLLKGSTSIPVHQLLYNEYGQLHTVFLQIRLPRTITAFTAGGLLALSGALMQLLLQNPLADPYVLGISSGAAFFTLLLMLAGLNGDLLLIGAWLGSLLTAALIIGLARRHQWQIHTLLLTGIALAGGFAAGISLILVVSPSQHLHGMLFWLMGDLNDTQFSWTSLIILLAGMLICLKLAPALNILGRGEKEAAALGLSVPSCRIRLFLLGSLFAAAAVTEAGCIGFVGLIVPHFARRMMGYNHRLMLPAAALMGGSLVVLADTLARAALAPLQIPVGIVLTLIGIPIFISMIQS